VRSFDYEPGEDVFDDVEPEEQEGLEGQDHEGDDYHHTTNGDNVVVSGDPNAGYSGKVMEQSREKKVPNDQRTTTPYLTKYERARVLGTRALQIRYVACADDCKLLPSGYATIG
jgi:DNA-directed RNA polymerase I, II, and III subunit RPABC2